MPNFWTKLQKPILILAPMEDVTDFVFRELIANIAKPDVLFTEFTNVDGLFSAGKEHVIKRLKFSKNQHPIVAQIWGSTPKNYFESAKLINEMGFDGIDINMGCPVQAVIKQKSGAGLIKHRELAQEIITATKEGANNMPISVKTRIGFNKVETEEWVSFLLMQNIAVLTIHGRTAKDKSKVAADWDEIKKAVTIRDSMYKDTLIIGNGDVLTKQDAYEKYAQYNVDGIMIGRGIFHNPWFFETKPKKHTKDDYLNLLLKHAKAFEAEWGGLKKMHVLNKFFKVYVKDFDGADRLRQELMACATYIEIEKKITSYSNK